MNKNKSVSHMIEKLEAVNSAHEQNILLKKNNNSVLHMVFLVSHMKKNTTDHKLIKYLLSFTHGRKNLIKIEITQFQKKIN